MEVSEIVKCLITCGQPSLNKLLFNLCILYLQVNVLGLSILTREFIKQLRERNVDDGHVVHLNRCYMHTVILTPLYMCIEESVLRACILQHKAKQCM